MKRILYCAPMALWMSGCGESPREKRLAAPGPAVVVHVVAASEREWPSVYEASGTVRARTTSDVAAKLMGYVREVKVQTGDRVKVGQLLITLDTRDLEVNTRRAQAALEEVRSAVPEADSAIAGAKSNFDLAQSTFKRMQDLLNKKSISNQEFDESAARLRSAQAAYDMAKAKRAQIDAQAARVQQDVIATEVTRAYAEITAPFAGLITAKSVEPGTLTVPGTPLLTIEREGSYRLEASVEESRLNIIRVGQSVAVTLDGLDRTISARVSEIVPGVDSASRSATVKLDLPAVASIRAGMFGRAAFQQGSRSTLVIPAAAVAERGQLQSVFVADNGIARARLITTGHRSTGQENKDQVEVLSGITAGDNIIVPVPKDLSDGSRIEVRP
jgi:membrane fusion protein, multidrug efflux system